MPDDEGADSLTTLPAAMSDILFALVAVVILVLLALAPLIRIPGALATQRADLRTATILVETRPALVVFAEAGGLRIGQERARFVPLDAILGDTELARMLGGADADIVLMIAEEGQEAAFLFASLAGAEGMTSIRQVRLDALCRHVIDLVRIGCTPGEAPA